MKEIEKTQTNIQPSNVKDSDWKTIIQFSKILTDIEEVILDTELSAITGVS